MRYRIGTPLIAFNGKPILESAAEDSPVCTLGNALIMALTRADTSKRRDQKVRMYRLVQRIYAAEHTASTFGSGDREIDFTDDEVKLLRTLLEETTPIAVMGPVLDLLDRPIQPPAGNSPLKYDDLVRGAAIGIPAKKQLSN